MAPCCQRRTSKLYVYGHRIACRKCLDLKYPSQHRKDPSSKWDMDQHKIQRYEKQKRRLWYGDHPTQFGYRHRKLIADRDTKTIEIMSRFLYDLK
jgi:hypothetical protein